MNNKPTIKIRNFFPVLLILVITFFFHIKADEIRAYQEPQATSANNYSFYTSGEECYPLAKNAEVKNVIFLIGDGMGLGQTSLARLTVLGPDGKLTMERLPVIGLVRTHSANKLVTDSAASGTAMSTGHKTNNGIISMTPDNIPLETIFKAANRTGMRTGLVATSTITHATPAVFASHVTSRNNQAAIAEQLIDNKVNIILGGGRQYFLPATHPDSKREDGKDVLKRAIENGYTYIKTKDELLQATGPYLLGLFQTGPMKTVAPEPSLSDMTKKAIDLLNKEKAGFILMVEGSQIDWACHANDPNRSIRQTLLFDQAVKTAMDFAVNDQKTIVIVTADHETGGLTVSNGDLSGKNLKLTWSSKQHSAMPVPLYAFGPKSEIFSGVYDNTEIPEKIAKSLKLKSFAAYKGRQCKTH